VPPEAGRPGPHPEPPDDLGNRVLPLITVDGPRVRIHRRERDPLFFGATGDNRFDAPDGAYGVCYVADDSYGAFVETFGWSTGIRIVTAAALAARGLAQIAAISPVRLVDLSGPGLALVGADARLCAGDHAVAQRWARALWAHPSHPDGLRYRVRHDPSRIAVALFNRVLESVTASPFGSLTDPHLTPLVAEILDHYGIGVVATESREERDRGQRGPRTTLSFISPLLSRKITTQSVGRNCRRIRAKRSGCSSQGKWPTFGIVCSRAEGIRLAR